MSNNDKTPAPAEKTPAGDGTPKHAEQNISAKVGSELGGAMRLVNSLKAEMLKPAASKVDEVYGSLELYSNPKSGADFAPTTAQPKSVETPPSLERRSGSDQGSEQVTKPGSEVSALTSVDSKRDASGKVTDISSAKYSDGSSFNYTDPKYQVGLYESPSKNLHCTVIRQKDGSFVGYQADASQQTFTDNSQPSTKVVINTDGRVDVYPPEKSDATSFDSRESWGPNGHEIVPLMREDLKNQDFPKVSAELHKLAKNLNASDFQDLVENEVTADPSSKLIEKVDNGRLTVETKGDAGTPFAGKTIVLYDSNRPAASMDYEVKGVTNQNVDELRNKLCQSDPHLAKNVEIQSTDENHPKFRVRMQANDDLSGTDPEGSAYLLSPTTSTESKNTNEVSKVFDDKGHPSNLDFHELQSLFVDSADPFHSFIKQNTLNSPLNSPDLFESGRKTRQQEVNLIHDLKDVVSKNPDAKISMAKMAELALKECNGDQTMALLTLTNFSKNVACVERRQFCLESMNEPRYDKLGPDGKPNPSYDKEFHDYANAYNNSQELKPNQPIDASDIDNIFKHIDGFDVAGGSSFYNKEGAFYHFWGAAYAAHVLGTDVGKTLVDGELMVNKHTPIEYGAGRAGAAVTIPNMKLDDSVPMDFNN